MGDNTGKLTCLDAPDIQLTTADVFFTDSKVHKNSDLLAEIIDPLRDKNAEVILDRSFACGHFHCEDRDSPRLTPLNPRWWTLAEANYASHLCSACGCS
ncbi:MAG: hypothetical protein HGJ94_20550 [Desulfosarcina sp.]|nr:hypothetical protein [Desulfosarcina sp.]MBC2742243.1 hypothetical protein [Desulfosarcina sp.]MBC2765155.1 hypothetical protein [Desulfosarcina sp.]